MKICAWTWRALPALCLGFAAALYTAMANAEAANCGPSPIGSTCGGEGPATLGNLSGNNQGAGNPINLLTGNKFQRETDLMPLPGELGIEVVRYYNSQDRSLGSMGFGWRLSYETEVFASASAVQVLGADGSRIVFDRDARNPQLCSTRDPAKGQIKIAREDGRLRYEWTWINGRRLIFDATGKLIRIVALNGKSLVLQRGARGELLQVVDPQGRRLNFSYAPTSARGFRGIVGIDTPLGRIDYSHDDDVSSRGLGNLTAVRLPDRSTRRRYLYEVKYSPRQPHALTGIEVSDTRGVFERVSSYRYAADGMAVDSRHGAEHVSVSRFGAPGSIARPALAIIKNAQGEITTVKFAILHGEYRIFSVEGAACEHCARSMRYDYDALGRVSTEGSTRYDRDGKGRTTRVVLPSVAPGRSHEFEFIYAASARGNQPVERIERGYSPARRASGSRNFDKIERRVSYRYDVGGRLVSQDGPLPGSVDITRFRYDSLDRLIEKIEPGGRATSYAYDGLSRLAKLHTATRSLRFEYDALGHLAAIDLNGTLERYDYDGAGRLRRVARANGETLSYRYGADGQVESIVDQAGRKISIERGQSGTILASALYEASGSLAVRRSELLPQVESADTVVFDTLRRPVAYTDPRGLKAGYAYDDFGRLREIVSADSSSTWFAYDAADRLIEKILPTGSHERLTYDAMGRVLEKHSPEGVTRITYARSDKPVRIVFPGGEELYSYDAAGRLTEHTRLFGGRKFASRFEYDAQGRLIRERTPGGRVLHYSYHGAASGGAGLLERIDWPDGAKSTPIVSDLNTSADDLTHRTRTLFGNVRYVRELDARGRLIRAGAPGTWQERYFYTGNGPDPDRGTIETPQGRVFMGIKTDAERRLTGLFRSDAALVGIAYDASGNTTARTDPISQMFTIDGGSNRVLSSGARVDQQGRTIFKYGAGGEILRAGGRRYLWDTQSRLIGVQDKGRLVARYAYNAMNQRIEKTVFAADGISKTWYLYERGKLVGEVDSNGRIRREYVWLDDLPVALFDQDLSAIVADHTYAPRALVDSRGRASPADPQVDLRGSHLYLDRETGLLYGGRRYVDASLGRFLTPDPLGVAGGANAYAFASGNPLARVDLLGLQSQSLNNESIEDWPLDQKLGVVFRAAADQIKDHDLAEALRELVSPASLATTAAIFSVWTAVQFTPYGWTADLAAAGIGALFVGSAVWDVIQTSYQVARGLTTAKCQDDLQETSATLALGLSRAAAAVTAAAAAGGVAGSTRIARLLRSTFERDAAALERSRTRAAANDARFGTFDPARGAYSGREANLEWIERQRANGFSDAHPPWNANRSVVDTWLNPGDVVYVVQRRSAGPGSSLGRHLSSMRAWRKHERSLRFSTNSNPTLVTWSFSSIGSPPRFRCG